MDNPALAAEVETRHDRATSMDTRAFVQHYEQWRQPIYRYLRSRSSSNEDAADLTATTFERAWRARDTYRGGQQEVGSWLFGVARRLAIDAARRRSTARRGLIFWPRQPTAPDPADLVLRDEADRVLFQHLAGLSELQREALLLRYAGGLSARQIGTVIGKGEDATQKLITRALGRLKEAYRDHE